MNWEENRELGVVKFHIFNSRISNSRKIPDPKKRELGGHTVPVLGGGGGGGAGGAEGGAGGWGKDGGGNGAGASRF